MKIFLVRHADAIEFQTKTVHNDEYRFITPTGRKTTIKVCKELKEYLKDADKIFTSPLVRAVQTAEIFAVKLKFKKDVELVNELRNESPFSALQNMLKENPNLKSVILVGHEPKMSILVKSLSDKKNLNFEFNKSGVCLIDYNEANESGKFEWYFYPKTMEFIK